MAETDLTHPILRFTAALEGALDKVGYAEPVLLTTSQKADALVALRHAEDRLHAVLLGVLAVSEEVAEEHAARDAASWLAAQTRTERGANLADARLAAGLARWRGLHRGHASGQVNTAQARVIADCLDKLPVTGPYALDTDTLTRAEDHLIALAADYRPRLLARFGAKILEVVAPEISEVAEAAALADEEQRARETSSLSFRGAGEGVTRITATVPNAVAHRLRTYLDAFTSPRHTPHGAAPGQPGDVDASAPFGTLEADRIPAARQRGHAFAALLETLDPQQLPVHGGDATAIIITMSLDQLRSDLATGDLIGDTAGTGTLTAGEVRRLACTAHLIPAVLGTDSQPVDLGRTSRLFTRAQRKAMIIRDRHCRAQDCTMPATFCEAHHWHPWSKGGKTDLADGILLCSWHHHRAHDDRYLHQRLPNGNVRFTLRT